jgi:hypothetical protein
MPNAGKEDAVPAAAPKRAPSELKPRAAAPARPRRPQGEFAPLIFDTKTIVGSKKPRERDAKLLLDETNIVLTADDGARQELYSVPYESVIAIIHSRSRYPMWESPQGPAPVVRASGGLGRLGIFVDRDWISLRTSTRHQFVCMRFDDVFVKRVLFALEERTGRAPKVIVEEPEPPRGTSR